MENHLYRSKSYFSGQNLMKFRQKKKLWNLGAKGMGFLERPFIRSGILWEHSGNNKIPLPRFPPNTLPKREKNWGCWVHAAICHWLRRISMVNCVHYLFWHRLNGRGMNYGWELNQFLECIIQRVTCSLV
jgi:hypothetical protein